MVGTASRGRRRRAILHAVTDKKTLRSRSSDPDDVDAVEPAPTRGRAGGDATVEEMSEWSFPASDPPSTWTWEVPEPAETRAAGRGDASQP
jgi:hypothetical protein